MKKHRSNFLAGLLVVALVAAMAIPAAAGLTTRDIKASTGVSIYVDDQKLDPRNAGGSSVEAFVSDGTTYLPVRALGAALGKDIGWDGTSATAYVSSVAADPKAAAYLKEYFDISFSGTVTRAAFDAALEKLGAAKTDGTGDLTVAGAVKACVGAAKLSELATAYAASTADNKVSSRLAAYGLTGVSEDAAPYVAAALDAGLVASTADFAAVLDAETAVQLLMKAAELSGQGRNSLGNTSDPDIGAKLRSAYSTFYDFSTLKDEAVNELWKIGETIVAEKATTGFGLKSSDYDARFLSDYTIKYGHSGIDHAVQLVALLNGAGLDAKVQLEPKVSIYEYGGKLNSGLEYDLLLEFATKEDKAAFHALAEQYVKRTTQERTGNIISPFWTPAYNVPVATEGYKAIYDNVISCGKYSLHPFSLPDRVENVSAVVDKVAADYNATVAEGGVKITTSVVPLWCNPDFYDYLEELASEADKAA